MHRAGCRSFPPRRVLPTSGSSKTRLILEALAQRQETTFFRSIFRGRRWRSVRRELGDIPNLTISGLYMEYLPGLHEAKARRQKKGPLLVLFLGSTIELRSGIRRAFLRSVRTNS